MRLTSSPLVFIGLLMFGWVQGGFADASLEGSLTDSGLDQAIRGGTFQQITSVLVAANGEVLYEQYWDTGGPERLNDTRSATKSLTAIAVGAAITDGRIENVDVSAFDFFEQERPHRSSSRQKDSITIKDLLTMSSSLDCDDNNSESPGNEGRMYPERKWLDFVLDMPTVESYQRNEKGYGPFHYCTAGSFFLGQIVERATGESVDTYTERRILKPLGIDRISWDRSPSGEVQTGGGAELTSRALLALGELVRNDGNLGGHEILSQEWVDEMLFPHVAANEEQDYGYQWWRRDFACGETTISGWYMAGNGGNKVVVVDELGLTIVITATLYNTNGMHQQSTDIIEKYVLPQAPKCSGI